MFQRNNIPFVIFVLSLFVVCTLSNPMYYKKNVNDKYEQDLVAYSSTVIPLTSYDVSYGIGGKLNEAEYKAAFLKHLHKKTKHDEEDPDTLITLKKKIKVKKESEKEGKMAKIESA